MRVLRGEVLSWFGILSTAFTVFSNAGAFIDFSNFVREWTDQWRSLVAGLMNWIVGLFNILMSPHWVVQSDC